MTTNIIQTKMPAKKMALGSYVFLISLLLIFPLAVVFLISFDTSAYINFPPKGFSTQWYEGLPANPNFAISVQNSLIVAFSSTLLSVLVAVPAALVIARNKFKGRNLVYVLCLSSLTVPWIVYGVALLFFWSWLGLELSIWTLIFGHTIIGAPYVLRTSVAVLTDMPSSYERGARSLGAGKMRTFWTVTLPLMLPGLTAGASFAFIVSVVNIPVSLFVTTADNITIPVAIFNYMQYNFDPGVAAFSIIQLIIIGVFIAFAVRAARTGAV
ncbi:ABC transporter permease [Herbaspirillum sp. LeCh32-8]|uniref:ABC transporter permease n=1 Tax=Herbaspirillum sp. LeCh32-8 TaxID=2821356 RepID=UPI001AE5E2B7|nr:ABC transporter permease [Herbaspirillum sp. LeCh32-8]MBP0598840.1 ABC transporter permease [Herbaspirillum sp. LeCh32-8]